MEVANPSKLQSEEVTYAELTLPRGKGYSQMVPRVAGGSLYAEVDHSRSIVRSSGGGGWGPPGASFSRTVEWQEEVSSQTPLVGNPRPQYVVWEGGGSPRTECSTRESKV